MSRQLVSLIIVIGLVTLSLRVDAFFSQVSQPNVVLVLTDDQGYGDLGVTGNPVIRTPNIDQLFDQGVQFERFYVSPVCSPTRASLLSGKSSLATGVFHVTRGGEKMHPEMTTLPEYLKPAGYVSGLFGKWHNGLQYPHNPLGQGFDEFYGFSDGHKTRYFDDVLQHNNETVPFEGYIADRLTDKAIEFITENQHQPFFTMLSYNTPHGPFIAPKAYFERYKKLGLSDLDASIYGMVENIDDNVARVLTTLKSLSLAENTIVIYLSDNGAAFPKGISRYNAGLKGQKGRVDEGGVRTPFIIKWPTKLAKGRKVSQIAQHIDLVPTLLDAAGIDYDPKWFHGKSLMPLIAKEPLADSKQWPERTLFTHRFQIARDSSKDPVHLGPGAVRTQRWVATLNEQNQWHLYDLIADPGQQKTLNLQYPEVLQQLQNEYRDWFRKTTEQHGPYLTQPIEVGHKAATKVEFPAHEGLIQGQGLRYQYHDGWAHDWITTETGEAATTSQNQVRWPIKAVSTGAYQVYLHYATPLGSFKNHVQVAYAGQKLQQKLTPFIPHEVKSERQFYTSEAAEYRWQKVLLGTVTVDKPAISDLTLEVSDDLLSSDQVLWIKALELHTAKGE